MYARGEVCIIAHPDERMKNDFKDIYRWDDRRVDGPRERAGRPVGIELWNHLSDWGEHLTRRNKELLYFLPHLGLSGPTRETLAWWDRLNMAGKRTFGVGGIDVHAIKRKAPWGQIEVFPYQWTFGTLTNYLLLDAPLAAEARTAIDQVYGALAAGRSYFVNPRARRCLPAAEFSGTARRRAPPDRRQPAPGRWRAGARGRCRYPGRSAADLRWAADRAQQPRVSLRRARAGRLSARGLSQGPRLAVCEPDLCC